MSSYAAEPLFIMVRGGHNTDSKVGTDTWFISARFWRSILEKDHRRKWSSDLEPPDER